MTTKPLLTLAIMLALPCAAMAENISGAMYTAPSAADTNHPAPTTQAGAPYGRIDIDTADQEHIATTAYVKGAYNSAIAAANNVAGNLNNKQDRLESSSGDIHPVVVGTNMIEFLGSAASALSDEEFDLIKEDIAQEIYADSLNQTLITTDAALTIIRNEHLNMQENIDEVFELADNKQDKLYTTINGQNQDISSNVKQTIADDSRNASATSLVSEKAVSEFVNGAIATATNDSILPYINSQRVEIYTTWNNDNAKTQVAFVSASGQQ